MNETTKKVKGFFGEFKAFITRGNVLDMAVGVIVGGAFTAIVTALSDHILKPIINWIIALFAGKDSLENIYTFLVRGYQTNEAGVQVIDLTQSIYIDWGAFISAIINFVLIAFVLFCIVKTINKFAEANEKARADYRLERAAVKKYRKEGLNREKAKERYEADLAAERAAAEEKAAKEAELAAEKAAAEKKAAEEKELVNTKLLEEIRDLLKAKNA